MKIRLFLVGVFLLLAGCVAEPQRPVFLDHEILEREDMKVGVILAGLPEPDVHLPGADCLLCIAAAEAMNSTLSTHVKTWVPDEFSIVKSDLVKMLKEKGVTVVAIEEAIDIEKLPKNKSKVPYSAKRNYASYKEKYDVNHLLVVDIDQLGVRRSYASYVPTSDPQALISGSSYLVELSTNTYKWYKPISITKSASGNWDEPPNYPALTNAYFQIIATSREVILAEF